LHKKYNICLKEKMIGGQNMAMAAT
jgi:hypothetical protein